LTNVYDVPAINLINKIADDLKNNKKVIVPEWALFVKTGCSKERVPDNEDWWYIRMASILRKIYIKGKVTVKSLRVYYGSKKNRGVKPEKFKKASGKIIRVCLQDLQKLGFVKISEKSGRVLTKKGQSYLDKFSSEIFRELYPDNKPFKTTKKEKLKTSVKDKGVVKKASKVIKVEEVKEKSKVEESLDKIKKPKKEIKKKELALNKSPKKPVVKEEIEKNEIQENTEKNKELKQEILENKK
jgi:small subunit ribosomal protein S19e